MMSQRVYKSKLLNIKLYNKPQRSWNKPLNY